MHFTRNPNSELGQICAQIEALEVYFPMEKTSLSIDPIDEVRKMRRAKHP